MEIVTNDLRLNHTIWVIDVPHVEYKWEVSITLNLTPNKKWYKNRPLSLGVNSHIIGFCVHAQTPILLAFQPWLKHLYYWTLSHGSNTHIIGLWAIAQTPILWLQTFVMQILTSLIAKASEVDWACGVDGFEKVILLKKQGLEMPKIA